MELFITTAERPSSSALFLTQKTLIPVFRMFHGVEIASFDPLTKATIEINYISIMVPDSKLLPCPLILL
jgi:hypothetical protein